MGIIKTLQMPNRPQNKKSWFAFRDSVAGETRIDIMDEIGGWGVNAASFRDSFSRIGKDETVRLHINSPGGDITDGLEIYNTLKAHPGTVKVELGAMTASIATVVAMAGDEISMASNGRMVVHNPWVFAMGESGELRKMADIMDGMKGDILAAYRAQTGLDYAELSDMMDEETWMTAGEAKESGFIDSIDGDEDTSAKNFDLSRFKNAIKFSSKQGDTEPEGSGKAGNGKQPIRLSDLENAARTKPKLSLQPQGKITMTAEEIAAQKAAQEKAIEDGINARLEAKAKRDNEIKAVVATVRKRDNRDFSDLAEEFIGNPKSTLQDFHAALVTSDKFKPLNGAIGGGVELVSEPLDQFKGTPGHAVVADPQFRAIFDRFKSSGRHHFSAQITLPNFRNATQTSSATSGSGLTSIEKLPGILELGVRPLTIEDLIAGGQTNNTTIRYMQEVTYTQAAASVAETGALANVSSTYQEIDAPVKDIGGYVEMSENLMADYPAVASFINQRLPYQVDRCVDDQLLNGGGTGSDITGILNASGVQTLAVTTSKVDTALQLQTLIRWQAMTSGQAQGGFEPDGYVIHPTDWETLVLTKDANGQYLARGPFVGSYGQAGDPNSPTALVEYYTLWGKKVVISPVTAQGTIVCGAWRMGAQKFDRQGLTIEMTNSNGTNFINRIVTVRGARRLALAVYRPASFATGTGY